MVWTTPSVNTIISEMATPPTNPQSQTKRLRVGTNTSTRSFPLVLVACVFGIVCVAPRCVTVAVVLQKDSVAILLGPGPLGGGGGGPGPFRGCSGTRGGVLHGSRRGVIQPRRPRSRREDDINDAHLMLSASEPIATHALSNSSSRQRTNDRFLTPPHRAPLPTDPTRTSTNPTDPTSPATTPPEAQQTTMPTTASPTTSSSSPPNPVSEISPQPEDTYHLVPSSTVSVLFTGATTEVGNILETNSYDAIGATDPEFINRTEQPIINRHRRFLFFKCWPSSHTHLVNNSKVPPWVTDIGIPYIFPGLLLVSWLFTSVALVLHILIPDLRANMGKIFMCYILSLWLKCITTPFSLFLTLCAPDFGHEKQACIAIAFVSYMLSMAYRFWLNIMCFDIWRKVSNLVRLEHVRPVNLLYYHLWGWGMPAMFGLMALLIREFAGSNVIKPGFMKDGQCWFDQAKAIHQFLYMNLPGGFLHIANIGFVIKTRQNCSLMQQTSIPEAQESNHNSVGRIHATTNYINEFNLQFRILNFMIGLWILWSISLLIQFITELWYFKVIPGFLISLQGLIIFFIFISNNHKRQLIQRKFPFLKFNSCCKNPQSRSINRQQSSSISSEPSTERRKKVSMMSITSLTSLFGSSATLPIEGIAEEVPVQELSSVSTASYNNTSEGGSVHLNLSLNRANSLTPREYTNGDSICEVAPMSLDKETQNSNARNIRKIGHAADLSELTLDPSNLILSRSVSCTYPPPNIIMDVNPVTVPVSNTLDD